MKIPFTLIVLSTLTWLPNVFPESNLHNIRLDRSNQTRRITRQTNADQMVQNILDWLGVQTVGNRKIRQDGLRTYLPPTQRPRPFEPAPPEQPFISDMAPPHVDAPSIPGLFEVPSTPPEQPEIISQYPAAEPGPNEIESLSGTPPVHPEEPTAGPEPEEEITLPKEEPVEVPKPPQHIPEYSTPDEPGTTEHVPVNETPLEPLPTGYPPAGQTPQPPFPPVGPPLPPIYSEPDEPGVTGYSPAGASPQPPFPPISSEPAGYTPDDETSQSPVSPICIEDDAGCPASSPTPTESEENGYRPATESEGSGYPSTDGTPEPPFPPIETAERYPELSQPPEEEEVQPSSPEGPSSSQLPLEPIDSEAHPGIPDDTSETPATPSQETVHLEPSAFPPLERESTVKPEEPGELETESPSPNQPSSPSEEPYFPESPQTPSLPEVNSVTPKVETTEPDETPSQPPLPEINVNEPDYSKVEEGEATPSSTATPSEEDLKHPPHLHSIDVECAKDMMIINIEFNRNFDGIIYSKGFYVNSECRYVNENSGETKYTFTVKLDSCGTQFVNGFDTANQSYLENVLVIQNELGIQEVWDTVRSVRCLWEGSLKKSLTVSLSVGMLSEEIVAFSGDTAVARLDIQRGEGPFAPSANGLVPIGEKMTLVISVSGDPGFDIQVKDCKAVDTSGDLQYRLTDEDGCVLRPKLFGYFQKTRDTGNTNASIIAYAYFNAFKFPDLMDLMIECNVELCKTDCDVCPNPDQKIHPSKRKRRAVYNETLGEPVKVGKLLRVLLPQDLSEGEAIIELKERKELCISVTSFVYSSVILISLLACSFLFSGYMLLKHRTTSDKHQF